MRVLIFFTLFLLYAPLRMHHLGDGQAPLVVCAIDWPSTRRRFSEEVRSGLLCTKQINNMAAKKRKLNDSQESDNEVKYPDIKIFILPQRIQKARLDILKNSSRRKGFEIVENFNDSVTHIISQYENKEKVFEHLKRKTIPNVEIVKLEWLTTCTTAGKPVPVMDRHRLPSKQSSQQPEEACASSEVKEINNDAKYICQRPCPLNHPNKKFTEALEILERHALYADSSHRDSRSLAFRRASCSLKALPKMVSCIQDVANLNHIGGHSRKVIEEILEKGVCDEVEEIKNSDFFQAQENFSHIYGCGPATGRKWFDKGYTKIDDLRKAIKEGQLKVNPQQHMGIMYYEGVVNGVTRQEANAITKIVTQQLDDHVPGCHVELVGGYRRGKPSGHDVDILVTHQDNTRIPSLLPTIVQRLDQLGHIVHKDMSVGKNPLYSENKPTKLHVGGVMDQLDHCFCMFKMDTQTANVAPNMIRRVDIIVAPYEQYPWALVGWTGSKQFNRSLRLYASKELNIAVSNHGAWSKSHTPPLKIQAKNEQEIFEALHLPYLEPHERNC